MHGGLATIIFMSTHVLLRGECMCVRGVAVKNVAVNEDLVQPPSIFPGLLAGSLARPPILFIQQAVPKLPHTKTRKKRGRFCWQRSAQQTKITKKASRQLWTSLRSRYVWKWCLSQAHELNKHLYVRTATVSTRIAMNCRLCLSFCERLLCANSDG